MKKWLSLILIVVFAACQKGIDWGIDTSSGGSANTITGTWKFVSIISNEQNTEAYMQSGSNYKTITYLNDTTHNNTGTVTFNADSTASSLNIGYSIDSTTANAYIYQNGVLVDSNAVPFSFSIDSSSSTAKYELIGTDSIYFFGSFFSLSGDVIQQGVPSGGKYSISGNTLTLTQNFYRDTTELIGDIPTQVTDVGKFVITLQKQ